MPTSNPICFSGSINFFCRSRGTSRRTGPGLPDLAKWIAFSISYLIVLGSTSILAYFVIGLTIETISVS